MEIDVGYLMRRLWVFLLAVRQMLHVLSFCCQEIWVRSSGVSSPFSSVGVPVFYGTSLACFLGSLGSVYVRLASFHGVQMILVRGLDPLSNG